MSFQLRDAILDALDELLAVHEPFQRLREYFLAMTHSIKAEINL